MALSETPPVASPRGPFMRVLIRSFTHFWLKSLGTAGFMYLFFRAYFYLLMHPSGPVTTIPATALDHWIGFQPWTLPLYLSLWVYVSLPVALLATKEEVVRYGWRIALLCLVGLGIFLLWPTRMSPIGIDLIAHPEFSILKGLDAAGNACPSLHVATAFFSAIWLDRIGKAMGLGAGFRLFSAVWCAGIVFSTIGTGQHVAIDVLGGLLLGGLGGVLSRLGFVLHDAPESTGGPHA